MKFYDPVHGFIHCDELEGELIDSLPFQRLRYIRQLGAAFLVYPGATHSRFEHSLGVMQVASEIFDKIGVSDPYWKKIIRLAALCHDLGHLPFSHVAEKAMLGEEGHEKWTLAIIKSDFVRPILEKLGKKAVFDVIKIAIGPKKLAELDANILFSTEENILSHIVAGDFFGADRIDYLLRDARCTGVSHGLFDHHQLIESIVLLGDELGIEEGGIESCEALLVARHFMHRRVYQYPSVQSCSFHLSRFMHTCFAIDSLDAYLSLTDNEVLTELRKAFRDEEHLGHEDAKRLFTRGLRVKAIAISQESKTALNFPVLRADGSVCPAKNLSKISAPSGKTEWNFIDSLDYNLCLDAKKTL